jgi:hypothetical protein
VLRPHIDGHRIVALPIFTGLAVLDGVNIFYILLLHKAVPVYCRGDPLWSPSNYLVALKLSFLRPRFLILIDMTAALVEFSPTRRAQRLASNSRVGIIRYLAAPVWLRQIKARQWIVLA